MGTCRISMVETMATLRTLADENLTTLKKTSWKDENDILRMDARIRQIRNLIETMNYDWERIPEEWDDEKKRAQEQ